MRLFTGIDLPEPILERLERLLARLRPTAHLRWSPVDNLHVTTKFIGELASDRLEAAQAALQTIARRAPVRIAVEGLGWFPNPHHPRVFFAVIHGGTELADLAAATESALEPLGIARQEKTFSPHLTLARISQPTPLTALRQAIALLDSVEFGSFEAAQFCLYESKTTPVGSVYRRLAQFGLVG